MEILRKMRVKIAGWWEREVGKWRQVRKDAVRNLQGYSAELASVESKNRGRWKKKCSFSRFFITLGSYPPIYIGTLLNESLRGAALERRRPRPIPTFGLMESSLYDKHTHQFLAVYTFYLFQKGMWRSISPDVVVRRHTAMWYCRTCRNWCCDLL